VVSVPYVNLKKQFKKIKKNLEFLMLIEAARLLKSLGVSSLVIPFFYGSGSGTVTGTVINYGSGSAKAKSYGSRSGSATLNLLLKYFLFFVLKNSIRITRYRIVLFKFRIKTTPNVSGDLKKRFKYSKY
jgi:hypothetical protein